MARWVSRLQSNVVFKWMSSVKLAVPLMASLLIASAVGTIYESRYNSQVAAIQVYQSLWFQILLILLWINIFSATLSRYPFKKHHLGFVVTHIGLLTLLCGGMITTRFGTDGSLSVSQGAVENEVYLSPLILRVDGERGSLSTLPFGRTLAPKSSAELASLSSALESGIAIEEYQPFVAIERGFEAQGGDPNHRAVRFTLKSAFFDVTDWLDSGERPEVQMGPATLRLISSSGPARSTRSPTKATLKVFDFATNKEILALPIDSKSMKPTLIRGVQVSVVNRLEQATVAGGGKIQDLGTAGKNPALELRVSSKGKTLREVVFAKFPGFALNPKGALGLKFEYVAPSEASIGSNGARTSSRKGNVIEFHTSSQGVVLELYKNESLVLKKSVQANETVQTPWMGMQITLRSAVQGGRPTEMVRPIVLPLRAPLPPSAIKVRPVGASSQEAVWVLEGSRRDIQTRFGIRTLYYGPESLKLPFQIRLKQFNKVDYPGTETAMSYESLVQVDAESSDILISMNEPLKRSGYTLYQSSYILDPGQPPISVFSVNRDPGRWIKYVGSLILVVGIALFTLMRSSWYLNRQKNLRSRK